METMLESNSLFQVAEIQLTYRRRVTIFDSLVIHQSYDAFKIFSSCWNPGTIGLFEESKILLLNRANKVLGVVNVSSGGLTGTIADIRLIFAAALKGSASFVILAHNHPSANLTPSQADLSLTQKIAEAGKLLDIRVLDHIILSPEGTYKSLADEGLM